MNFRRQNLTSKVDPRAARVNSGKPTITRRQRGVGLTLGQRCRQWTNIKPASGKYIVFSESGT